MAFLRLWVMAVVCCAWPDEPVGAQVQAVRRESVTVASSPAAERLLAAVLEAAAAERWPEVSAALDELERLPADELVEVDSRRWLQSGRAAQVLRSQCAPAMSGAVSRGETAAQALYLEAREVQDVAALADIWQGFGGTLSAAEALDRQAELCWQRNQMDQAAALWRMLEPTGAPAALGVSAPWRVPTSALSAADLAARQVLIELFSGDTSAATQLLQLFERDFAAATGTLAGRDGPLRETLQSVRSASRTRADPPVGLPREYGSLLWRVPLADELPRGRLFNRPLLSPAWPPAVVPSFTAQGLFWAESDSIHAVRLVDGQPLWPTGEGSHLVYGTPTAADYRWERPYLGEARHAVAVADGRLWATLGAPFALVAARESRPVESQLICLDIESQQGKLLWTQAPEECLPDATWRFSGPPLVAEESLYLAARRGRPAPAIGVVCLNAGDGHQRWFREVAGLLNDPAPTIHQVASDPLTAAYDRIYLGGNWGAVACLSAETGQVEWLRRDQPLPQRSTPALSVGAQSGRGVVCHRGRVYALEHDQHTLLALDAFSGAMDWQMRLPGPVRQIAGAQHGLVHLAGEKLWAIDQHTGAIRWQFGCDDVEGQIAGQVLLAEGRVRAATVEEVWELDAVSGTVLRRVPLADGYGVQGGHVLAAGARLLVVSPTEITGWGAAPIAE